MPQNQHSERKKKFIEKLKAKGTFEDYKKKRAVLEKARRIRQKEAIAQLTDTKRKLFNEEERLKNRKRVQKHRNMKKDGMPSNNTTDAEVNISENNNRQPSKSVFNFSHSYKTTSAISKAYCKTNKTLPSSPTKRKVVVAKLVRSFDVEDRHDILGKSSSKVGQNGLRPALISAIQNFYERDDVSRISPNVKDARSFRNPITGEKELIQIRHLIYKLSEVYSKFVEEYKRENNSDPRVKKTKFCELRPQHVMLIGETPRNVCYCIYHSNFIQCCTAINKYIPELPKHYENMVKLLVCKDAVKDCYFKKCKKCSSTLIDNKLKASAKYSTNKKRSVEWLQWVKHKEANRFQNEVQHGTIQQLVDYLLSIYSQYLKHSFVMHEQQDSFNIDQDRVDSAEHFVEAVLQIDFPENYKCQSQNEVQQANYNQKQPMEKLVSME